MHPWILPDPWLSAVSRKAALALAPQKCCFLRKGSHFGLCPGAGWACLWEGAQADLATLDSLVRGRQMGPYKLTLPFP